MTLMADFDNRTVNGMFDNLSYRDPGDSSFTSFDGEIAIQGGIITTNGVSANLVGQVNQPGSRAP